MCGIVGLISGHNNGFSQPEVDAFTRMLYLDTLRGWDSTGIFGGDKNGNIQIIKDAVAGPAFIGTNEYKAFSTKLYSSGKFVVGHNRAATRGTVTDKNAHPFWIDEEDKKIVLVQNGTWYGEHKHIKDTEVDTEALLHLIATEETVQTAINKISAAYALVWYDVLKRQLNFLRNDQRPLYIAAMKNNSMVFASEWETIEYVTNKNGWKYETNPFLLKEDNLWTITFDTNGNWSGSEQTIKKIYPVATGGGGAANAPFWKGNARGLEHRDGIAVCPKGGERQRRSTTGSATEYRYPFIEAYKPQKDELISLADTAARDKTMIEAFNYFKENPVVLVEAYDYFPANDSSVCSIFHITAKLIHPFTDTILDRIVCYWTLSHLDEHSAIDIVHRGFYNVDFSGLTCFKTPEGYFISARCASPNMVILNDQTTTEHKNN